MERTRHGRQRARELIAAGAVDVFVTWECSRAARDLVAYSELRDLCVEHRVRWSYSGRVHDMANGDDRFRSGLDALMAEREADETSERIRSNATLGRPHGRRLFGYERIYDDTTDKPVGQELHPAEAPVVRHIFDAYLAGHGYRTIAQALNAEGITTGGGARWKDCQFRRVLTNPAYAARRVHQGEVIGDAAWPALVATEVFDKVQARMEGRQGIRRAPTARLLTGVARRGVCGARLAVGKDRVGCRFYQCGGDRGQGKRFCVVQGSPTDRRLRDRGRARAARPARCR